MSNKTSEKLGRKATVWTRDKISHLIKLYQQHECLWNHFVDEYRSKDHRSKAIDNICSTLRISKFDFGKKVHNLRNQFNSEMKKLERRIEEAGDNPDENTIKTHRCRWEHFEALMFLRKVIEPRPGFQNSFQAPKKLRLKYEESLKHEETSSGNNVKLAQSSNENIDEYHIEESTERNVEPMESNGDDFHEYETVEEDTAPSSEREERYDNKYNPATSRNISKRDANISNKSTYFTCLPKASNSAPQQLSHELIHLDDHQPLHAGSVIELSNNNTSTVSARDYNASANTRDQWDIFGELIANEFRLLNSDISRKKLKRKIMQDLLLIGEEDDKRSKQDTF